MKYVVWLLLLALVVLHQDYWQWGRTELVFGFLPYSLAYHAAISLAAAFVWLLAVTFCWPQNVEDAAMAAIEKSRDENRNAPRREGGEGRA